MEKEQFKYLVDQNKKLIAIALPVLAATSIMKLSNLLCK